jgi:predicted GNAT family acetyltransferase
MATLRLFGDANEFLARAQDFLLENEVENSLILGIASSIARGRYDGGATLALLENDGEIEIAAVMTPPRALVISTGSPDAAAVIAQALHEENVEIPGVNARSAEARAAAERLGALRVRVPKIAMSQRIYKLVAVLPPSPAKGALREATREDRDLLVRWIEEFGAEAIGERQPAGDTERTVDFILGNETAGLHFWEVDGAPVSLAGYGSRTRNGVRIGPVYTPKELRGRGYASNSVAALSARMLASGARFCCLYTDLANPTSNAIYQRIGYSPVCDANVYTLDAREK